MALFEFLNGIMEKLRTSTPLNKVEIALIKDSIKKGYVSGSVFARVIVNAYTKMETQRKNEGKKAYMKLQAITNIALNRVIEGKEPFTEQDKETLESIFNTFGFDGKKVAISYITNFNMVFGMAVNEQLEIIQKEELTLAPKKETEEKEKQKIA